MIGQRIVLRGCGASAKEQGGRQPVGTQVAQMLCGSLGKWAAADLRRRARGKSKVLETNGCVSRLRGVDVAPGRTEKREIHL
jgi:hypothetical protein